MSLRYLPSAMILAGAAALGQQLAAIDNDGTQGAARTADAASVGTRPDARTITLTIPAPRGLITDRQGKPFAQNRVGYQLALNFAHFPEPTDGLIVNWARARLVAADRITGEAHNAAVSDQNLLDHYKDRRWLPFVFSDLLDAAKVDQYRTSLVEGLILHPIYYRHYPEKTSAAHVIGYVRSKGKLPTGPITRGELLFEDTDGQAGLEQTLDADLTGEPGERNLIFDVGGKEVKNELTKRPRIGKTVVTTLNLDWQKHAEEVLAKTCKRGAFVVVDIPTGEVLVLASLPSYDINVWIPRISDAELKELNEDPAAPMFGRAFQGQYPPASAFKPVVALTALTNGVVAEWEEIYCPAKIEIGNKWFHNHTRKAEGSMAVARALARSNNCWFYQVGIKTGPSAFLSTARRLGFGSKTGLPLFGESPGRVPTDQYVREKFGRGFTDGDTANYSIGQAWEATPLQVAQAMAGIANGSVLPRLHLIKQVQDPDGGVLRAVEPEARNTLTLDPDAVQAVHKGMMQVVHAPYGTGSRGSLSFTQVAAKTGTGQWISNRELAWFAGFFPYEDPRIAFAVLYEGMPGETVSGGRKAAPMVRDFFEPLKDEILPMIKPPAKATIVVEEGDTPELVPEDLPSDPDGKLIVPEGGRILKAIPVEPLEEVDPVGEPPAPVIPAEGDPLPAIPVEDAPQAVPVDEDEE